MNNSHDQKRHMLLLDAIAFHGGSKVAMRNIIRQLEKRNVQVKVISRDLDYWKTQGMDVAKLYELPFLDRCESGLLYFLKHFWIALFLLRYVGVKKDKWLLVGSSGPGVDLSLYLLSYVFGMRVCQFVQGPVAISRTIARCLLSADIVVPLASAKDSIRASLSLYLNDDQVNQEIAGESYIELSNGIAQEDWPSRCRDDSDEASIFWAASLLRWKGLDLLVKALRKFERGGVPKSSICFIRPKATQEAVSSVPHDLPESGLFENPSDIDQIRQSCNVFVSTSRKEPFGLSILEAMAAGLCVVIPKDGAYWDCVLVDGIHCIKYEAESAQDLFLKLRSLQENSALIKEISSNSLAIAEKFRAEVTYQPVVERITHYCDKKAGFTVKKASIKRSISV